MSSYEKDFTLTDEERMFGVICPNENCGNIFVIYSGKIKEYLSCVKCGSKWYARRKETKTTQKDKATTAELVTTNSVKEEEYVRSLRALSRRAEITESSLMELMSRNSIFKNMEDVDHFLNKMRLEGKLVVRKGIVVHHS